MRPAWIQSRTALTERLKRPIQLAVTEPESEMPPYMEQFLAHLRLLVGVPFDYLVPDERLLPDESIRFFYLDRSWTDRLVDGAIAVGKIGTREQAHHHGHAPAVHQQLDLTERVVRVLQRGLKGFIDAKTINDQHTAPADTVTGFLLRSSAVSGWPHMDVRAYKTAVPEKFYPADPYPQSQQLTTLRLELLSPGVMIALFQGVPQLVTLEEPHAGVMFGVHLDGSGIPRLYLRDKFAEQIPVPNTQSSYYDIEVPFRATNSRVVHVTELYRRLNKVRTSAVSGIGPVPTAVPVTGSASYAIAVLDPPWRQRFEGTVDNAGTQNTSGGFVAHGYIAQRVAEVATLTETEKLVTKYGH
ncbi:hypothetical protein [Occallatibacter riparius]|uniref:Uncharacterized protein n=1 Tax=Occallatibacter riparius TaxID=1002689 RepID=A0A9J7BPE3_9BACT|nr:hypothetical protein [Occallatibacter riparius]UWZ84401.1 hypothetical protein MOP44_00355 [Occallatibacter riparius]